MLENGSSTSFNPETYLESFPSKREVICSTSPPQATKARMQDCRHNDSSESSPNQCHMRLHRDSEQEHGKVLGCHSGYVIVSSLGLETFKFAFPQMPSFFSKKKWEKNKNKNMINMASSRSYSTSLPLLETFSFSTLSAYKRREKRIQ